MRARAAIAPVALALLVAATVSAYAQMGGGHGRRQQGQQQSPKQSSVPSGPVIVPQVWPRLDEGAVLCKSRDDLVQHQHQFADASGGAKSSAEVAGCRTVQKQTGIEILDHDGPSRTKVMTTDDRKETGWTDAFLPSTPPPSVMKRSDSNGK